MTLACSNFGESWRCSLTLAGLAVLMSACSDDGSGSTAEPSGGVPGAGGSGSSAAGTMSTIPSPPIGNVGGAANAGGGTGGGNSAGTGGTSGFAQLGVCGQRGESPVSADSFAGFEEYYLIGDDGFGEDICVVRFAVTRVGEAPGGCEDCTWTHRVEYGDPEVLVDVDGVCGSSQLGLDSARIEAIDGSQTAYGFVPEYSGHVSVLMKYDEATGTWGPNGNANWSEETGELRFDRRDGFCGY